MKLCKNCKYYKKQFLVNSAFATCTSPNSYTKISPITGERKQASKFVEIHRQPSAIFLPDYCGKEGRWFEEKDESFKEIKRWWARVYRNWILFNRD